MRTKRKLSILVPYKVELNSILIYLQKRSKDAKRLPDHFGFWGGGAENSEGPEEALLREIKEEMGLVPEGYFHFKHYEFDRNSRDIFVMKTDETFEDQVEILEGEYGKWFGERDVVLEPKLIEEDRIVLRDVYKFLRKREEI